MKIFRQVMASDRLPKKDGHYFTNNGELPYYLNYFRDDFTCVCSPYIEWWLEEIELPSEKDKQVIVKEWYFRSNPPAEPSSFIAGFNKAIELIKGK